MHTPAKIVQHQWYAIPLRYLIESGCTHFFWIDQDDIYLREHVAYGLEDLVVDGKPVRNVADRAPAFNIPGEIAFGNDIFEVRRVARRAIEHARSGKGPYLIEFKTFRQRGHGEHDDMGLDFQGGIKNFG